MKLFVGAGFFLLAQCLAWFQLNSQLMSKWWSDKPLVSAVVFGIPASLFFWHAWKNISESFGSVWSARFVGSGIGFLVFPILTWYLLGESMFTLKTMTCIILSVVIILVQIYA